MNKCKKVLAVMSVIGVAVAGGIQADHDESTLIWISNRGEPATGSVPNQNWGCEEYGQVLFDSTSVYASIEINPEDRVRGNFTIHARLMGEICGEPHRLQFDLSGVDMHPQFSPFGPYYIYSGMTPVQVVSPNGTETRSMHMQAGMFHSGKQITIWAWPNAESLDQRKMTFSAHVPMRKITRERLIDRVMSIRNRLPNNEGSASVVD